MEYIKVGSGIFEAEMPQLKSCEHPRQVRWTDFNSEDGHILYGIQFGDKIISAYCGDVFLISELNELAYNFLCANWVEVSEKWISFSDEMAYNW